MFEFFDHTADLGLRVRASTLSQLFVDAAHGLTAVLIENPSTICVTVEQTFDVSADNRSYLLFDWLHELLFVSESQQVVFAEFDLNVGDTSLAATARGEPIDGSRHQLAHEVKAITYHGLTLEHAAGEWFAEVIVDI